jgi:threonine synthase
MNRPPTRRGLASNSANENDAGHLAAKSGIDVCPEGGAAWAALHKLRENGFIQPRDSVVIFNTVTGLKYR